jgi:hypothetical protein
MAEERRQFVDQVLDRFVFAPIGVAAAVARTLPRAAEEGRRVLEGPMQTAQFVSQMAAGVMRARYGDQIRGVEERIGEVSGRLSSVRHVVEQVGGGLLRNVAQAAPRGPWAGAATGEAAEAAAPGAARREGSVGGIEAYADLSAAEVIERLEGLSNAQLAEVELYELEHRRRRTILARIAKIRDERRPR